MLIIAITFFAAVILAGGALFGINYWLAKKNGEVISKRYIGFISVLLGFLIILFTVVQFFYYNEMNKTKLSCDAKIQKMIDQQDELKRKQKAEIDEMRAYYAKELAFSEWKNRSFVSKKDMRQALAKAKEDYQLSDNELRTWKGVAENNTIENLLPKKDTRAVLTEYQSRLRGSLKEIKSGNTLLTSDIRMLTDNINAVRLVGKEYERVLDSFKELYANISTDNGEGTKEPPKQKKFLFFPVKTKEYNQLMQQYYESKGNQQATAEVAAKLKLVIEKSEEEMKRINKKFEDNLGFLQTNSDSISYNSAKLQKVIEAAISQVEVINETDQATNIKVNEKKKN